MAESEEKPKEIKSEEKKEINLDSVIERLTETPLLKY